MIVEGAAHAEFIRHPIATWAAKRLQTRSQCLHEPLQTLVALNLLRKPFFPRGHSFRIAHRVLYVAEGGEQRTIGVLRAIVCGSDIRAACAVGDAVALRHDLEME